jgi:HK97 family phage portal protein
MLIETIQGTAADPSQSMTLYNVVGDTAVPGNAYINEYSAMTVPGFWSGVRFICESLASFRRSVYQELPDSRMIATAHPLNTLLRRRISDISSPYKTIETWIHHATVWGNGYLWIKRDSQNRPIALINMSPDITAPFVWKGEKKYFVKLDPPVILDDQDVLHIAVLGFDGIRGYPLVQMMRYALETPKLAEQFQKDFLKQGTFVNGSVETPEKLTDEQYKTLKANIRPYSTPEGRKRFGLLLLSHGASLKNSTIPNQTSQMIESRKFSDIQICQILRISPHIIYQLDSQKLANVQQMGADVVRFSLSPWATKIEDEINAKLFSEEEQNAGYVFKLDMDALLRGDSAAISTQMMAETNGGIRTVNEARRELGLPPVGPQGDQLRVPVNFPNAPGAPKPGPANGPTAPLEDEQEATQDPPADPGDSAGVLGIPANGPGNPQPGPASYAVLQPIIDAAIARIEDKTAKAFTNRQGKPADELTRWGNVFSAEQRDYVTEAFAPIAAAATAMQATIDVSKLASRYETEIKRRAAGNEPINLAMIFQGVTNGQ